MSRLGKISFIFAVISLLCFAIARSIIVEWIPFFSVLLGLFGFFILFGVFTDRKFFGDFFSMKTTKHGLNMGVLIFGFIGLVITANILGARHYKTWDFSINHLNSLSDQSVQLLKNLKSDLKVIYLYKQNSANLDENRKAFTELIRRYQDQTSLLKLEFVEADEQPDVAKKYDFKGAQAVYLDYNGKTNRIEKLDEQTLTSALVRVTREKSKIIYFTTGHGEADLESMDLADGTGFLKNLLKDNNYAAKSINFASVGKMPTDMDALAIVGPMQPFQGLEIQAIEGYLKGGGNVFVALSFPDKSGLEKTLSKVGIQVENGFVMNVLNSPMGPIVVPKEPTKGSKFSDTHSVTKVFSKNDGVSMMRPMALKKSAAVHPEITVDELVVAPASMFYTDPAMVKQGNLQDHTIAMAAMGPFPEGGKTETPFHLIAFGDFHFLTNQMLSLFVNRDLLLNSVALLAKEENLISITPKEPGGSRIDLTSTKEAVLFWGLFLPMPLAFLIASLFIWMRRRHA